MSEETTAPATETAPEVKAPPTHHFLLPANLACLAKLVDDRAANRWSTGGVQLTRTETGYRAEATNGRYLGIVTGEAPYPSEDYPTIPALANAPNSATRATVGAKDWLEAFKLIPKRTSAKPILGTLAAVLGEKETTFGATDLERSRSLGTLNVEGRFPDTDRVIPAGEPAVTFAVDPGLLIELLEVARQFTTDEHKRVTFEIRKGENGAAVPVVLRVKANPIQEFTGVIVPLA